MRNPFEAILPSSPAVTTVVADDIDVAWSFARTWGDDQPDEGRVVLCRWANPPAIDRLIDDVVIALADVALADWPHWFGVELVGTEGSAFERNLDLRLQLRDVSRKRPHVVLPWLKRSAEMCMAGRRPFDARGARELQAGQLSLAICPEQLTIVMCVTSPEATGGDAVIAAAEWFHRVTGASVVILIPQSWCDSPEIDRHRLRPLVVHVAPTAEKTKSPMGGSSSTIEMRSDRATANDRPVTTDCSDETQLRHDTGTGSGQEPGVCVSVTPLTGRPHPGSKAELALYQRIQADAELAPLLKFNQSVKVDLLQKYRVDVVCERRKVAIEVDGDDHRASAAKYSSDCERDYRLMRCGYIVLRLPNDLVVGDIGIALARIRDILRCRESIEGGE